MATRGDAKFEHFLRFYNIRDVEPFVEALMKMMKFYIDRDIDLFKCSISAPGIARRMLYDVAKKQQVHFSLFDQQQESLYCDFKRNLTGGPSIIFNRHAEVGKTFIRGNPLKPCKRVVGVDANALYLWAIGQAQPTGRCIVRTAERKFRVEIRDKYTAQYDYLDWLAHSQGIHIQHNHASQSCFFFSGCYFHGHECPVTEKIKDPQWITKKQPMRLKRTERRRQFIESLGYEVVTLWECEWRKMKTQDEALKISCPPGNGRAVSRAYLPSRIF